MIEVQSGPAPEPNARGRRHTEEYEKARTLAPQGWFVWTTPPKDLERARARMKKFNASVIVYRAKDKRVIVKNDAAERAKLGPLRNSSKESYDTMCAPQNEDVGQYVPTDRGRPVVEPIRATPIRRNLGVKTCG